MTRPGDWTPVGYSHDPVPGDPAHVSIVGRLYVGTADSIDRASRNLQTSLSDDFGRAEVIDAIREQAEDVARRIGRAEERYRGVGEAMIAYARALEQAQADSAEALSRASEAQSSESSADALVSYYQERIDDPSTPPANLAAAEQSLVLWQDRLGGARSTITSAHSDVQAAVADRDAAAEAAIAGIRLVESSGDLNDGFWDNVAQWVDEHKSVLDTIGNVLGVIAAIAVFVALLIPGLNILALAIITLNLVYTIANGALQVATGNMSTGEAIVLVAVAALNFVGAGVVVKSALSSAKGVSLVAARALPGATRSGARATITNVVRYATPATVPRSTLQTWEVVGLSAKRWAPAEALATLQVNGALLAPEAAAILRQGYFTVAGINLATTVAGIPAQNVMGDLLPEPVLPWRLYGDPQDLGVTPDGTPVIVHQYGQW